MALPPKKGQAAPAGRVNNYLEEMAADAQQAAEQETKPAGGKFISFKNCEITVDGVKLPGAQMAFVLLDGILENRDFEFDYDAENLRNPRCFAFGRAAKEMTHHEMSEQPQCDGLCTECWANKWKSATTGSKKGKHCKEIRRVAFIPAGQFLNGQFEPILDPEHYERAQIRHFHVPPTSVGEYSGYIHAVDSRGAYPDKDFARPRVRCRDLFKCEHRRTSVVPKPNRSHPLTPFHISRRSGCS